MSAVSHADLIGEVEANFQPVLERSPQGVYLWLDETHKVCNERLAQMFGYTVAEWRAIPTFLERFVAEEDRERFSDNFHESVFQLTGPITFRFRAVRKDGSTFLAETDMIPITYQSHQIAYHFVRQVGA